MHSFYTPHPEILYLELKYNKLLTKIAKKDPTFYLYQHIDTDKLEAELMYYKMENKRLQEENQYLRKNQSGYLFDVYKEPGIMPMPYNYQTENIILPAISQAKATLDIKNNAWHIFGKTISPNQQNIQINYYINKDQMWSSPNILYYNLEMVSKELAKLYDKELVE